MKLPATVERIATGFQFTEGPVWMPARGELLFSDILASRICKWKDGKVAVWREPSHQANGNALDPQGRLLTCEHETRRVTRTEPDGTITVLADRFEGQRLNSPNDVTCRRDGSIYFTDPPYGVKPELRELDFQGVYRVAPVGRDVNIAPSPNPDGGPGPAFAGWLRQDKPPALPNITLVAHDFVKPNGLAFSPDESILYIADTERGHLRAFEVAADGGLANGREFCRVERPDGFRVDWQGNLYIACMNAVEVFDPTGQKQGEITLPERPANLCFGDPDRRTLFICARASLYRARGDIPGR